MLFMHNMYQTFKEQTSKEHPDWKHELQPGQVLEISCPVQEIESIEVLVLALNDSARLDIKGPVGITVHMFTKGKTRKISDRNMLGTSEEVARKLINWISGKINRIDRIGLFPTPDAIIDSIPETKRGPIEITDSLVEEIDDRLYYRQVEEAKAFMQQLTDITHNLPDETMTRILAITHCAKGILGETRVAFYNQSMSTLKDRGFTEERLDKLEKRVR
jgi:hypothetical protein